MGAYAETVRAVEAHLARAEAALARGLELPPDVRAHRPVDGGWTIDEILEHVALTNHFLLLVIEKHAVRAEARAARDGSPAEGESDLAALEIDRERLRTWPAPEHMRPSGALASSEVQARLAAQLAAARAVLRRLAGGAGALARVRMSVADLGPIDLYQWLAFLALHAERHGAQMQGNAEEHARRRDGPGA